MQQWEYALITLGDDGKTVKSGQWCDCKTGDAMVNCLYRSQFIFADINIVGAHGWELVSVNGNTAYFKRPITVSGSMSRSCGSFEINSPSSDEGTEDSKG
jgi:hypothetical protein